MAQYRVRAKPIGTDEDIVMELFTAQSDAEQYYSDLQESTEENIINSLPYPALAISMEEFVNGVWTYKSRRIILK